MWQPQQSYLNEKMNNEKSSPESEIQRVRDKCSQPNWDGCGAAPVSDGSVEKALVLIRTLSMDTLPTGYGADPDGCIALEWHHSTASTLSVSVSSGGTLHWAAIIGPVKWHGMSLFDGYQPEVITLLIAMVMSGCYDRPNTNPDQISR